MAGDAVPLSAIKSIDEVVADPHVRARGMIVDVPVAGQADSDARPSDQAVGREAPAHDPAPALGEHNAAVLQGLLGLDDAAFAALSDSGVI